MPAPPATTRCFRWIPAQVTACRRGHSPEPVEVQITGSSLIYDLADPRGGKGAPVKALAAQFPDMRRFIREGYVRYAFTRFGVPYVVSIQCLDSAPRARRLACREAYPVAERFLKALRIAGGQPARPRLDIPSEIAERPEAISPDFTYRPSGDIIARSGARRRGGHADLTAYSQIRFPLEKAPAIVSSQSFGKRKIRRAQRRISVAGQFLRRPQFPGRAMRRRLRPSGPGYSPAPCLLNSEAAEALPSQEAGRRRRPRRHPDPFTEAAGRHAADQHPQRAHPLSLHAHEPFQHGCRRHS